MIGMYFMQSPHETFVVATAHYKLYEAKAKYVRKLVHKHTQTLPHTRLNVNERDSEEI